METKLENEVKVCSKCVMDSTDPHIVFDEKGVCDFCHNFEESIKPSWQTQQSLEALRGLEKEIRKSGKGNKHDCVIGLSGGVDSCYLAYIVKKELNLRPLMVSVDTGWNLAVANENVEKLIEKLNLDKIDIVVDWEEMSDLQLAFLKAQVPYNDTPQDHAIFAGIYNYAVEHGIKYVMTGANFSTECVQPPFEWVYMNDLKLIKAIHKKYGKKELKTFPLCGMFKYRVIYRYFKGMHIVHPLNMISYNKEEAKKILGEEIGWVQYENKHYENVFTRFYEGYWLPKKFGYDKRKCYFSSEILTNQMTRQDAIEKLKGVPYPVEQALEDMAFISDKLGISVEEFKDIMDQPNKTYRDYPNDFRMIKFYVRMAKLLGKEKRNFRF